MKQLKTASDKQKPKYDFLNLNFPIQGDEHDDHSESVL